MPSFALTVPYMRASPIQIPRRDLVLSTADSLFMRITIVACDDPCAPAIDIGPGIGAPSCQLFFWIDTRSSIYVDYRVPFPERVVRPMGQVLWQGAGAVSPAIGAFDFSFPSGTMTTWPWRCGWCVQLNYDTQGADVLLAGSAVIRSAGMPFTLPETVLQTDDFIPIHTDTEEQVLA